MTMIVVSHDRHFLNSVCTNIADIDYDTVISYPGNYDDMITAKTAIRDRAETDAKAREKKIEKLQEFIAKFGSGTRASSAKSYLMDLGISGSRMSTISYGEERPMDPRSNEEAWAKNRRANFTFK